MPPQVSRSVGDDRQGGESAQNQGRSADVHEHDRCPVRGCGIAASSARTLCLTKASIGYSAREGRLQYFGKLTARVKAPRRKKLDTEAPRAWTSGEVHVRHHHASRAAKWGALALLYPPMTADPAAELVRWVRDGEHLFRLTLQSLQGAAALGSKVEELAEETRRLQEENAALRRELEVLRAERLEVADTFKVFAEHVTRLATLALHRLGTPGLLVDDAARGPRLP